MAQPTGAKGETWLEQPSRAERATARRSAESRATVPDLELTVEAEMSVCLAALAASGASLDAALIRACAVALLDVPRANGTYRDAQFELHSRVNVGFWVEADDAYTSATIFDADQKSLRDCDAELTAIVQRARSGQLSPPELAGATFSLSNPGRHGVASATPIVQPPQAAALAAGTVRHAPVVRDGAIVTGHLMTLTLACDHRILFEPQAARFLRRVQELLEEPAAL